MSNARNLANLLGTNTTIQTAKLADSCISTAKIADDALTAAKFANGGVVNVARQQTTTDIDTSATDYNTLWSFNYTPVLTSSKVYFHHTLNFRGFNNSGNDGRFKYKVNINGTAQFESKDAGPYDYGGSGSWVRSSYSEILEYTNTGSAAIAWQLQAASMLSSGSTSVRFNEASGGTQISTCIIIEVAN